jgi:hypothetical protein
MIFHLFKNAVKTDYEVRAVGKKTEANNKNKCCRKKMSDNHPKQTSSVTGLADRRNACRR